MRGKTILQVQVLAILASSANLINMDSSEEYYSNPNLIGNPSQETSNSSSMTDTQHWFGEQIVEF